MFWRTYKRFSSSGQNDPARWGSFSDGDTLLDYCFALFHNHNLILELANPEVGAAGVEGDDAVDTGAGTRAATTNRKRKLDAAASAFQSLVDSSASMAASAAKHTRFAEMVSLSATLKNLRDCNAAPGLIRAIEKQLEDAISPRPPTLMMSTGGGASDLPERPSSQGLDSLPRGVSGLGGGPRGESAVTERVDGSVREGTSGDEEEGGGDIYPVGSAD